MRKMNQCPNCRYEIDLSENFCGNCGYPLKQDLIMPKILPNYARLKSKPKINRAIYVSIFAIAISVVSGLLLPPIYMILFAFISLISATFISYHYYPKIKIATITISSLLILAVIGLIVFSIKKNSVNQINSKQPLITQSSISTDCYDIKLNQIFNFTNTHNTCSIEAYNGPTINKSSQLIKIYAINNQSINYQNFLSLTRLDLKNNLKKDSLATKIINLQPAYFGNDLANKILFYEGNNTAIMEFVYHPNESDNIFLILYGQNKLNSDISLNNVIKNWQWKNY